MKARKYPRITGYKEPKPNSTAKCLLCGVAPCHLATVEVNIFRGDDEVLRICRLCGRDATQAELAGLIRARLTR